MSDARVKRFLLYAASAAMTAALLYAALRYLLVWLLPFLIAAAAAAAMEPAVRFFQARLRFKRGFSSLVLTLFLLFLLGGLLSLLGTTLTGEAYALLERAPALFDAAPAALDTLLARIERYSALCPPWLRETISDSLTRQVAEAGNLLGSLVDRLIAALGMFAAALPRVFLGAATCVLAIYFTSSSWPVLRGFAQRQLSSESLQTLRRFRSGVTQSAARWLRAELTLCAVTFAELLAGFAFLRQPYALLLALLITLVDALPVFGTGTVLVPWALAEVLFQNIPKAVFLAALYLVTLTVRNVLEPRLLGAQAGLPPILSLLAMYLGFCSFGVAGMVLFPFLLLLGAQLWRQTQRTA
ncbi:MAG: sporulation integral membrane protein YtvI [Oscillospiraceae bacterium]|nr:sporulation integral membrane protein YtvI [Oscillospiraceae bacterium]